MKRLVLHIGDHKTGSSSLQRSLAHGLLKDRLLYPECGRANGAGHSNLAWQIGRDKRFKKARGGWSDLATEIAASDADLVVLSSEAFEFKSAEMVTDAIWKHLSNHIHDVQIIGYFRPHGARILSSYGERVKRGIGPFSLDQWIADAQSGTQFDYSNRLKNWQHAAAELSASNLPARMCARIFTPACLYNGNSLHDFVTQILPDLPADQIFIDVDKFANPSPSDAALRVIELLGEAISRQSGDIAARNLVPRVAKTIMQRLDNIEFKRRRLSLQQAQSIKHRFADDAAAFDRLLPHGDSSFCKALQHDIERGAHLAMTGTDSPVMMQVLAEAAAHLSHPPQNLKSSKPKKAA